MFKIEYTVNQKPIACNFKILNFKNIYKQKQQQPADSPAKSNDGLKRF